MGIDPGLLSFAVIGIMILMLISGMAVSFVLLTLSAIGFWILRGVDSLDSLALVTFSYLTKDTFLALPTFIFMATVLEVSGIGARLYDMMYKWMAGLRGGLAMGSIAISTIIAAMSGSSATATVILGTLGYPEMRKRGYDKKMIVGCIPAGGNLGPLIPPSVTMIIVASITTVSIGKLFIAGVIPGLMASFGFMLYIAIRCWINPKMGPPIPKEDRVSWKEKLKSLNYTGLPIALILLQLILIYVGIATPSEVGGVGAFGALVCAALYKNLNLKNLEIAGIKALRITCMLMWLLVTGGAFSQLLGIIGVQGFVSKFVMELPLSPWAILMAILILVFILGMFIDAAPIAIIFLPVFYPVVVKLGFDPLWFNIVFTIDLIVGLISPPFGMTLFYFKGLNFPDVNMREIYMAILPYLLIMIAVMVLVIIFPGLGTWLPNKMIQ